MVATPLITAEMIVWRVPVFDRPGQSLFSPSVTFRHQPQATGCALVPADRRGGSRWIGSSRGHAGTGDLRRPLQLVYAPAAGLEDRLTCRHEISRANAVCAGFRCYAWLPGQR